MFKVICIEGGNLPNQKIVGGEIFPKDGKVYTASQHSYWADCYDLAEMPPNKFGKRVGYQKRRFAPCSGIDETELIRERQKQLV